MIGAEGRLEIRPGRRQELEREYVEGTYWSGGLFSRAMAGHPSGKVSLENGLILLTDLEIREAQEVVPLLAMALRAEIKSLLLVAAGISEQALSVLLTPANRERVQVIAVKAPAITLPTRYQELEDLAILSGGRLLLEHVHFPPPPAVITCLATSPNYAQDGLLFVGTLEDGLFYSTDCGLHWQAGSFGLLDLKIFCLSVSPNLANDQTLFAGTHSGLFRSTNGGRSWREISLPSGYDAVLSLALSPHFAQDGTLFAGTETQGLLRSDNGGRSWARLGENILTDAINTVLFSPQFPRQPDILTLHGGTLLLSQDAGLSWQPWREAALAEKHVTTVLAPLGFDPGAPSLIGLLDGDILNIR